MTARDLSATFIVTRLGRIEDADDAACELVGYSRSELLALHGADLIAPEDRPAVAVSLERMHGGEVRHRRGRLVRKDGVPVRVDVRARRLAASRLALIITALPDESA